MTVEQNKGGHEGKKANSALLNGCEGEQARILDLLLATVEAVYADELRWLSQQGREIIRLVQQADDILILTHPRPDPDAIGSARAMQLVSNQLGKTASIVLFEEPPESLRLLLSDGFAVYSAEDFEQFLSAHAHSLIVITDIGDLQRIAQYREVVNQAGVPVVIIDHHRYCKLACVNLRKNCIKRHEEEKSYATCTRCFSSARRYDEAYVQADV